MSQERPCFVLPPCPICSHGANGVHPIWMMAHRTSHREKRNFYMWTGCLHAQPLRSTFPVGEPEEWKTTENAWREMASRLFEERCGTWPEERRNEFAQSIGLMALTEPNV